MRLIDADALIDALMAYTWRDEDERLIDDADEKREFIKNWMPDLPTVGQWISVQEKDKLPEMHMTYRYDGDPPEEVPSGICKSKIVQVAVLCKESGEPEYFIERGFLRDGEWWECDGFYESPIPFEVTHWMPLPEPPEVKHDG